MTTPPIGNATKPRPCGVVHGFKGICEECRAIAKKNRNEGKNRSISKDLRMWILKRDDFTCQYCGSEAEIADHVVPISKGGKGDPDNLISSCWTCNSRKRNKSLEEFIKEYPKIYGHLTNFI
jgi:5-methylcytosine-specific restriction endonuclease McrA